MAAGTVQSSEKSDEASVGGEHRWPPLRSSWSAHHDLSLWDTAASTRLPSVCSDWAVGQDMSKFRVDESAMKWGLWSCECVPCSPVL
eukprot:scaffold177009_cov15-Tisochrysis_lutea.AAC.1